MDTTSKIRELFDQYALIVVGFVFALIGAITLSSSFGGSSLPVVDYNQTSSTKEYEAAKLANVKDGLSGMFVSRENPDIHWFVVDHLDKISGDWTVFAIDSVNDKLVWRGKFKIDDSDQGIGSNEIPNWGDIEDLTGYEKDGKWYLAIWNNAGDWIYEFEEPTVRKNQSRKDVNPIPLAKKVHINNISMNVEGIAHSAPEDAMYILGPRGSGSNFDDNEKSLRRVDDWSTNGSNSEVSSKSSGKLVARPINADVPNAVGALDISADGNVLAVQGVAANSSRTKNNTYLMPFVKLTDQTWQERLEDKPQLTKSESFAFPRPSENGAFSEDMSKYYAGGEGSKTSTYGHIYSVRLNYTEADGSSNPPPSPPPGDGGESSALGWELPVEPTVGPRQISCSGVNITTSDNWQNKVDSNPEGTTFCIKAGVHKRATVSVKKGNTFIGELGTIMDGEDATRHAFTSENRGEDNVTIKNLEIKRYNPPSADPWNPVHVIDPNFRKNWTIENNEIHDSTGSGLKVYANSVVRGNYIHHMERFGLGGSSENVLVENNEVAFNGKQKASGKIGYDVADGVVENTYSGGQGGMKFAFTEDLIFRGNYVHHNAGQGFWTDIDNLDPLIESNISTDNSRPGFEQEIGCGGIFRHNIAERNGFGKAPSGWMGSGGILVSMSPNTEIYENILIDNHQGIVFNEHNHSNVGAVTHCTPRVKNSHVHDNYIQQDDNGPAGMSANNSEYGSAAYNNQNNRYENNKYIIANDTEFRWDSSWFSFSEWQDEFPTESKVSEIPGYGGSTDPEDPDPDPPDPDPTDPTDPIQITDARLEAEAYREGGEGVGYHETTADNKGNGSCRDDAVDMAPQGDGCAITWISDGEWLKYDVTIEEAGSYTVTARVANGGSSSTGFDLEIDGQDVAGIGVPTTGAWWQYTTVSKTNVDLPAGEHTLTLTSDSGSYNIDWLEFELVETEVSSEHPWATYDPLAHSRYHFLGTLWAGCNNTSDCLTENWTLSICLKDEHSDLFNSSKMQVVDRFDLVARDVVGTTGSVIKSTTTKGWCPGEVYRTKVKGYSQYIPHSALPDEIEEILDLPVKANYQLGRLRSFMMSVVERESWHTGQILKDTSAAKVRSFLRVMYALGFEDFETRNSSGKVVDFSLSPNGSTGVDFTDFNSKISGVSEVQVFMKDTSEQGRLRVRPFAGYYRVPGCTDLELCESQYNN